jgi:carbon storage regulator CsrA
MLVLTRKQQEKIRIGDHIVITVLKMKGKSVRLGIEAPAEVPVLRGELTFAGHAVEWLSESNDGEPEPPRLISGENSHADRARAHWPTKPQANGASPHATVNGAPRVSLQRVSREQVSQVLPKIVAGAAPLRAMLDRRSVSA